MKGKASTNDAMHHISNLAMTSGSRGEEGLLEPALT